MDGGYGDDYLTAGFRSNLIGGEGNDTLDGGDYTEMTGGRGNDVYTIGLDSVNNAVINNHVVAGYDNGNDMLVFKTESGFVKSEFSSGICTPKALVS